jgi:uncharacterized integral membrane protein (TIGR00698 family)
MDRTIPSSTYFLVNRRNVMTATLPGILLSLGITFCAWLLEHAETALLGRPWLETLVLAILLGSALRTLGLVPGTAETGIRFSAKYLLETAVVLLGFSVSAAALAAQGWLLLAGIGAVVALSIAGSYLIGRLLRLPHRMALLIACGNSICGNSAIAAVAPAIDADGRDVATAIGFTAVLGIGVVLLLPVLDGWLALTPTQYGILAGMTVYAVPQVLAATAPVSALSLQVGTLVKLVRVLMLGPVVLGLSLFGGWRTKRLSPAHMLPWFIAGFLGAMGLRTAGWIPAPLLLPLHETASVLTSASMAALGLGVDARSVLSAGRRVSLAVLASLAALCLASLGLIRVLATA